MFKKKETPVDVEVAPQEAPQAPVQSGRGAPPASFHPGTIFFHYLFRVSGKGRDTPWTCPPPSSTHASPLLASCISLFPSFPRCNPLTNPVMGGALHTYKLPGSGRAPPSAPRLRAFRFISSQSQNLNPKTLMNYPHPPRRSRQRWRSTSCRASSRTASS